MTFLRHPDTFHGEPNPLVDVFVYYRIWNVWRGQIPHYQVQRFTKGKSI